ncbi:MAG TPA: hypothetical protein VGP82_11160 [Ktedonobacterales bacterium]|nr:hypothetical protein [Ktedonobacterales bacterium]
MGQILRAALSPIGVFFRNLRDVLWPGLILAGIFGAAISVRRIQQYLHVLSDTRTCDGTRACADLREFALYLSKSLNAQSFQGRAFGLELRFLALAMVGGGTSVMAIFASARIVVAKAGISWYLYANWLQFALRMVGGVLLVFWTISLGLSALEFVLQFINASTRAPFPPPGISTAASFVYFCVMLIYGRFRSGRWPGNKSPSAVPTTAAADRRRGPEG